ncbi:hypothetical protein NECID01_0330 [Nematocida sp. AWRm77]|nr:hypothetical protein NECID01_0330 [Nematocida sp. AWRm77]
MKRTETSTKRTERWKQLMHSSVEKSFFVLKNEEIASEALQNIKVDIDRSVCRDSVFLGDLQKEAREYNFHIRKEELRDVLVAFARYNTVIEYCQGLSYYAAFLLQFYSPEDSFLMLCQTIQRNEIEALFDKKLSLVSKVLSVHGRVLNLTLPECIRKTVQLLSNNTHDYAAGWYLTLFSRLSPSLYAEVLDLFFTHGFPVLFHVASALVEVGYYNHISVGSKELDHKMQILFKLAEYPVPEKEFQTVIARNMRTVSISSILQMLKS